MRKALALCLALVLCFGVLQLPARAESGVTYAGNAGNFIFAPGSNYSPTDLFPDFKDVIPGDTLSQQIRVKNNADNKVKVKIYLRALGAKSGSEAFLSQLQLKVTGNTGDTMFEAAADQTGGLSQWYCIGTLYSGGESLLTVDLLVPTSLDNQFQNQVGYLDWQFMVEEFPIEPDDPVLGSEVIYLEDAGKVVFEPGTKQRITELFPGIQTATPGSELTDTILFNNPKKNEEKVDVRIWAAGTGENAPDILSQMQLKVTYSSDGEMFAANAEGNLRDGVDLGIIYSGGKSNVTLKLILPENLPADFRQQIGHLTWYVSGNGMAIEPTDPTPKTGDQFNVWIGVAVLAGSGIAIGILLFAGKKRKKDDE